MLQQIVVVTAVCFIAILCSQSVWTYPLLLNARNHQPGRCTLVPGIEHGSEDIQVLPNGLAFITSGLGTHAHGVMYLFDFWKPRHGVHSLEIIGDIDRSTFTPHGISIWTDTNRNIIYLYVINHNGKKRDTVEKFRFDEKRRTLYHLKTFQDDRAFTHLNDLTVAAEDSFYFTNDFKSDIALEFRRGLPLGNVGFYDGAKGHVLLTELCIPNGIAMSLDGRHVYLAISREKRVNIYTRSSDNTLKLTQVVPLCSIVDNIDVDVVTGDMWVAGHAHGDVDVVWQYLTPPYTSISSSQVYRLTTSDDGSRVLQVDEVYHNDGRQFSGASTAVPYRRLMLVGSVYTKMLLCEAQHA